jgi:hypothetical protein
MSLSGVLDFQRPLRSDVEELVLYFPFEGGTAFVLPEALALSTRPDGQADFELTLIRGVSPNLPPVPHGLVELGVQARYPIDRGLRTTLTLPTRPQLAPAPYQAGFLRWQVATQTASLPPDLQEPIALNCNGVGAARLATVVTPATIDFLKKALDTSTLLTVRAVADLDIGGVAPRLPLTVQFDPAQLLTDLSALADPTGFVTDAAVVDYFRQPVSTLPLVLTGAVDAAQPGELAETLRDWVRSRFGQFAPAPVDSVEGGMRLAKPETVGSGTFVWDLSEPLLTGRSLRLELNPLEAAQKAVAMHGLAACWHEAIIPPLPMGQVPLSVYANLPDNRANVLLQGAELTVSPHLPGRPAAIRQTLEFSPPSDRQDIVLRLSPAESAIVGIEPFVIVQLPSGVRRVESEKQLIPIDTLDLSHRIALSVNDFPVNYAVMRATDSLLEQATVFIRIVETGGASGDWLPLAAAPLALAWPTDIPPPILDMEARSLAAGKVLSVKGLPFSSVYLGLEQFAEYGPHAVTVTARFDAGESLLALDLLPESSDDIPDNRSLLFLTPGQPQKTWSYLVSSPFRTGFRYRRHLNDDAPGRWSLVQHSPVLIVDSALE